MRRINQGLYSFIVLLLGLAAAAMLFLPVIVLKDTETTFTGLEAVFGTQFASLGIFGSGQIELSILGIIAVALPIIGALCAVLYNRDNGAIVSMFLFSGGAVLLFLLPTLIITSVTILGQISAIDVSWTMGYGLIIAIVAASFGAIMSLLKIFVKQE